MKTNIKKNGGFTLVELIVVIAILAILAAVAIPAYSGYIEKANKAGDLQLLGAINEAFTAACVENGEHPSNLKDGSVALVFGEDETIDGVTEYNEQFCVYFAGNESAKFEVIDVYFVGGVFKELSDDMQDLLNTLREKYPAAADALLKSGFNAIGYDKLATQIENAAGMLGDVYVDFPGSNFNALLNADENTANLTAYAGGEEAAWNLLQKKIEMLKADPKYADIKDDPVKLQTLAQGQLLANTAILTAAKQENAITPDFKASLANGTVVETLRAAASGGNADGATIAQAAYSYAMYTSYLQSTGATVPTDVDVDAVYDVLGSQGFKDYMNNVDGKGTFAADEAGYLGAMQLIAGSADNAGSNTANDILLNGFNNAELVGLLNNLAK